MTSSDNSPQFLQLLAHDLRWQMLQALSRSDLRVQELAAVTQQPQNLVSYHLGRLLKAGLLNEHRSIADGREVYYSLDISHLKDMYLVSGRALHPALGATQAVTDVRPPPQPLRVLFLCTHNSARSQMAEGLMNRRGQGWVKASSAGLEPTQVHPMTLLRSTPSRWCCSRTRSSTPSCRSVTALDQLPLLSRLPATGCTGAWPTRLKRRAGTTSSWLCSGLSQPSWIPGSVTCWHACASNTPVNSRSHKNPQERM